MAYTDRSPKNIKNAWGKFYSLAYEAISAGDLVALDASNDGMIIADEEASVAAIAVALTDIAAGEEGHFALAVEIETQPTIGDRGIPTAVVLALITDVASPLYLDGGADEGEASTSAGATLSQQVGFILSTTRALLCPGGYLTGTAESLSGNLSVGGTLGVTGASTLGSTLAVTGASTLTGLLTANGGVKIGTGKNLEIVKGYIIDTPVAVSDDATIAAGVYLVDTSTKDVNVTLPAAAAGITVRIANTSATKQLTVTAGSGDKLINASGAAKDSAKGNAAAYNNITLLAVDTTNWITLGYQGTWTYS